MEQTLWEAICQANEWVPGFSGYLLLTGKYSFIVRIYYRCLWSINTAVCNALPSLLSKRNLHKKSRVCPLKRIKHSTAGQAFSPASLFKLKPFEKVWVVLCKFRNDFLRLSGTLSRPHRVTLNPPHSDTSALCITASYIMHVTPWGDRKRQWPLDQGVMYSNCK